MAAWLLLGLATGLVFSLVTTMLTKSVPQRSASMIALNSLGRNCGAALAGSVTQPLAAAIGTGYLYTALAVVALGNLATIAALRTHGQRWRENLDSSTGFRRAGGRAELRESSENSWNQREHEQVLIGKVRVGECWSFVKV